MKCKDCYQYKVINGSHYCFRYALKSNYENTLNRKCLLDKEIERNKLLRYKYDRREI